MNFRFTDGEYKVTVLNGIPVKWELMSAEEVTTLHDVWKPDAPIRYDELLAVLTKYKLIDSRSEWVNFEVLGGKRTSSRMIKGLYEFLEKSNCIKPLSMEKVKQIFNATFNTQINHARVLNGSCEGDPEFFRQLFSLPEDDRKTKN